MAEQTNKPSEDSGHQVNDLQKHLKSIRAIFELWDDLRTNPDGSLNEDIEAKIRLISYGEEVMNRLNPDLPHDQKKHILEKLEAFFKHNFEKDSPQTSYLEYIDTKLADPSFEAKLEQMIRSEIAH